MNQDICWLSATELAEGIRSKTFSSQEVVQAHLDRIAALNPTLNAIVTFAPDPLALAKEADAAIARGAELGALHGVPFHSEGLRGGRRAAGDPGLQDIGRQHLHPGLDGVQSAEGSGRNPPRQDQPSRVCPLVGDQQPAVWRDPKPLETRLYPRRLQRRRGRIPGYRNVTLRRRH